MTFHPRMQSRIEGITVVDDLRWRAWNGVIADVWSVECTEGAGGEYVSPDPRLIVVLDKTGDGGIDVGTAPGRHRGDPSEIGNPLCYVPAGLRVWSRVENLRFLRHLDLHFDMATLGARFAGELDAHAVETPRLMFSDERVQSLARLIAAECTDPSGLNDLYGDGLTTALLFALLQIGQRKERKRSQLPPRQLRRAVDYIEDNCLRNIRLQELADLTGLSQSYFSHAFKASTGMAPHKWQMRARIARVKSLLGQPGTSLTEVATAAGFADQAHFTRVFKRMVGTTPASWQRGQAA